MRLHFVDRSTYRRKSEPETLAALLRAADAEGAYVVPEGGSNALAVRGCRALGEELRGQADVVAVACGTGGTLAGLAAGPGPRAARRWAIPVLKGGFLAADIRALQERAFGGPRGDWCLDDRFHFGGYARTTPELDAFAADFEDRHGVPVERALCRQVAVRARRPGRGGRLRRAGPPVAAVVTGRPFP